MDAVFKALADPGRRELLALLRRHGQLNLSTLAEHFDLSLATISSHMRILAEAGLVSREKRGRDVYFSINTSVAEDLLAALYSLLATAKPAQRSAGKTGRKAGSGKGVRNVRTGS